MALARRGGFGWSVEDREWPEVGRVGVGGVGLALGSNVIMCYCEEPSRERLERLGACGARELGLPGVRIKLLDVTGVRGIERT